MKKKFVLVLGICVALCLCACGKEREAQEPPVTEITDGATQEGTATGETVTEEAEETPAPTATPTEVPRNPYEAMFDGVVLQKAYKGFDDTNPIMTQRFGADPYAMVYGDRVYFYMTADDYEYDSAGNYVENTYGKIKSIRVVSTVDMVNFEDHGAIKVGGRDGAATWANNSWAPAAAWKTIDGQDKFFLYFADSARGIGVLVGDSPVGPFTDPVGGPLINRQTPNCGSITWLFDPAVLVDDDGTGYLYFGGGVPAGKEADPGNARVVKLNEDMVSLAGEPVTIDVPYLFEDSGIHKYNDKYYYTYCSNWQVDAEGTAKYGFRSAEIVSMESDSPMGPFTVKETILENPGRYFGLYGNNHHCVFQFRDQWYITYHTRLLEKTMGLEYNYRSTHVDAFTMQEDGTIGKIKQTKSGRKQLQPVDAYAENSAACFAVQGGISTHAADTMASETGAGTMAVGVMKDGCFIKVTGVDFGETSPAKLTAMIKSAGGDMGAVQIRLDKPIGDAIGTLAIDHATGTEYEAFTAELTAEVTGVHDVYFVFCGKNYLMKSWKFEK